MFLPLSKHLQSRISSRDGQYLWCFQLGYKLLRISGKFWKFKTHLPGLLIGDIFLFGMYETVFYNE